MHQDWRALYHQAICEDGATAAFVAQAQDVIQQRVRELWQADSMGEPIDRRERQELHSALYFLNLLCLMAAGRGQGNPQSSLRVQN
jgi:hypothetical protein